VYTPDELGAADLDADVTPAIDGAGSRGEAIEPADANGAHATDTEEPTSDDLTGAALEGGYSAATVVELCRFFYDQPRLGELTAEQAAEMAGRLRLARIQGVSD
jgi:hypothetical protein